MTIPKGDQVIRNHISKDRIYNGQQKIDTETSDDRQLTTQKTKH